MDEGQGLLGLVLFMNDNSGTGVFAVGYDSVDSGR